MANENNISTFTALDIEKYHQGLLSAKEMHQLEKAALEDPFLADALEGYAVPEVNVAADLAELQQRLAQKTQENKVIPIASIGKSGFPWLRVAAMIILVAGAGLLVYQLGFRNTKEDIAQTVPAKEKSSPSPSATKDSINDLVSIPATPQAGTDKGSATGPVSSEQPVANKNDKATQEIATITAEAPKSITAAAPERKEIETIKDVTVDDKYNVAKEEAKQQKRAQSNEADFFKKEKAADNSIASNAPGQQRAALQRSNIFRGQITDPYNNALPFANITNPVDNVGTYSDARGYFTLTSPDTTLQVQVRSIGFENSQIQLRNNVANNQVVLQEDKNSLAEVVVSNRKVNSNRARNSMTLEEPEPADGWNNYDTYIANNLHIPENDREKQIVGGEVELSFEVDKNGGPVNIKVTKSLCKSCDKEAIRLIKEGPKWKRKAKKGRTTVTVPF